jgi:hypothetical protein
MTRWGHFGLEKGVQEDVLEKGVTVYGVITEDSG